MKASLLLGLLASSLFVSAAASAQTAPCPDTLTEWAAIVTCVEADKEFAFVGTDLPGDTQVEIDSLTIATILIHTVSLNFDPALLGPGSFFLDYTVQILDPTRVFDSVSLDTDVPSETSPVSVTKEFAGGSGLNVTLTSTGGVPSGSASVLGETSLGIHETFDIQAGGALFGTTNTYTQTLVAVAQPSSVSLLGTGLLVCAGWFWLRRRAPVQSAGALGARS